MTSSVLNEDQLTLVKPDAGVMINRDANPQLGYDRSALRTDFAPVNELAAGEKYVEEGAAVFLDAETTDQAAAPTSVGEVFGNIGLVRVQGGRQEIPRYTHGFTVEIEDGEPQVGDQALMNMRDGILEMFDIAADLAFLQGMTDDAGNTVFKGVFQWLQDNMPSSNIIDADSYDLSSGDLGGIPANIIVDEAYGKADNLYMTTNWDMAVAKPSVFKHWNQYGTFDGAVVQSQWELVSADENSEGVGVGRRVVVPPQIGLPTDPSQTEDLTFSIDMPTLVNSDAGGGADDVMFLIPNHGGDFYELYERGEPDHRVVEKEGFRERHEYKWAAGVVYGQNNHKFNTDIARDVVKIENVSTLFA